MGILTSSYMYCDHCIKRPYTYVVSLKTDMFYPTGRINIDQGWGLLSQFSPFRYFPHFPLLSKQTLAIEYHVYIWQVSPQLSCGDTCQIWMWFKESNRYFCKIENFAYGEISERSFSNPHPWQIHDNLSARRLCLIRQALLYNIHLTYKVTELFFWQSEIRQTQSNGTLTKYGVLPRMPWNS